MSTPHGPLRRNLRTIDAPRAQLQTSLIAALNRRRIDDLHTQARLASERDRRAGTAWIQFRSGEHVVRIAPLLVDGALARVSGTQGAPDPAAAAATLARIEPLLGALELVLGRELHPAGLDTGLTDDPVLLRLDASTNNSVIQHRLLVAVPAELTVEPLATAELDPGAVAGLRLRWAARFAGPAVRQDRLAAIARGDLLLLGTVAPVATLSLPGRNDSPRARLAVNQGMLVLQEDVAEEGQSALAHATMTSPPLPPAPGEPGWGALRVPTTIEIAGTGMTAAELATLGRGSVLPLPASGGTLPVRIIASDQLVAEGELVAVGEGYGVLITQVAAGKAD